MAIATLRSSASIASDSGARRVPPSPVRRGTDKPKPPSRLIKAQPGSTSSPTVAVNVAAILPRAGFMWLMRIMRPPVG